MKKGTKDWRRMRDPGATTECARTDFEAGRHRPTKIWKPLEALRNEHEQTGGY